MGSFPEPRLLVDAYWQKSLLAFLAFVMIILLTLIGRTALFDMERLYMCYIYIYIYYYICMLTVPTCGNNLWANAVAGAQKFILLINTMNDLLSISRSLSVSGN